MWYLLVFALDHKKVDNIYIYALKESPKYTGDVTAASIAY